MITTLSKKLVLFLTLTTAINVVSAADTAKTAATDTAPVAAASSAPAAGATTTPANDAIAINDTTVIAKVTIDDKVIEITFAQLKEQLKSLPANIQSAPIKDIYEPLLQNAINLAIVNAKAEAQGIANAPDVKRRIDECRPAVIQKAFIDSEVEKLQTPEELKKAYDELIKLLPKGEEVSLKQAVFKSESVAKKFITSAKKNNFDKSLEEFKSENKEVQGGDTGYVRLDALPAPMLEKVTKAAKATLITHPIHVEAGGNSVYFVIYVTDKRPASPPTYEQALPELKQYTFQKLAKTVLDKVVTGIKVERTGLDGKPIADKAPAAAASSTTPAAAAPDASASTPATK